MPKKKNYNDGTKITTRAYTFDLVIYEIDQEYLQNRLDMLVNNGYVNHYAYIQHDKDIEIDENGNEVKKPLHTHLLINFDQNVSVKQIKERILEYTEHNTFGQPLKDKRGAYRYLTHKDNVDKYQYDESLIHSNDDYFKSFDKSLITSECKESDEINQMINDYGTLSYRQLAIKYGRDFIKNFKAYEYYFNLIINQEQGGKNEN